jgi:apolipoprotein N-acyltransferase
LKIPLIFTGASVFMLIFCAIWGFARLMPHKGIPQEQARFACIQGNINQNKWGPRSLDTSFSIAESLITIASQASPDCIVLSESSLLCYLARQPKHKIRVLGWSQMFDIPLILGALHWNPAPPRSPYEYNVYNTAFLLNKGSTVLQPYFKMKLVPFSEVIPFEGLFPILSRVNLGEADFKAGTDPALFHIRDNLIGVPLICYEIIYPDFVRKRSARPANILINITNDGWFGRTNGPFHHAAMSQMRSIENGISLVRCANSGISMLVDPYGRILKQTGIYSRDVLIGDVPTYRVSTFYSRHGDWVVWFSILIIILTVSWIGFNRKQKQTR